MTKIDQDMSKKGIPLNVLILEDRESDAELILHELRSAGYYPSWERVETEADYKNQLKESLDLIIADFNLPQFTGRQAIDILNESGLGIPLILVTGAIEETALECLQRGAVDYLLKDRLGRLGPAVKKALKEKRIYDDNKQSLEALRASEQRYRGVAETALTGLSIADPDEKITYSNPALANMLGYLPAELLGMSLTQIIDPDKFSQITNETEKRKKGLSTQYETQMRTKSGEPRNVIISASPLTSKDGDFEGSQAVITDITKRKEAEIALGESEEKLRLMIDNSPIGFCATDLNGNFLDINPAIIKMIGYTRAELLSKHFSDVSHPDDNEENVNLYQQLVAGEIKFFDLEKRYIHKNGKIIHVLIRAQLAKDYEGKPLFEFALIEDITERRKVESQLKLQSLALESAANAIVITDAQGEIQWVNPAFSNLTGYSFEEALGVNPRVLKSGQHDKKFYKNIWDTITAGEIWQGEIINKRNDGELYTEEMTITPLLSDDGVISNYIAIKQDVTERVQSGQEIHHRTQDLTLINKINSATNQGRSLDEILDILIEESKRTFDVRSATVFLYDKKQNYLVMQNLGLPPRLLKTIEKLIGASLPDIRIPVGEESLTQTLLMEGPQIINDPEILQQWMLEFASAIDLPEKSQRVIRKSIPQIYKLLDVRSLITVPLISAGEYIGLIDFSRKELFSEEDADRIFGFVGQVTSAIKSLQAEMEKTRRNRLLETFSQAAPVVQRANNAKEIYSAIGRHVAKVGIDVTVLTLNEDRDRLFVSYEGVKLDMLRKVEKMTGLSADNYSFKLISDGFFNNILTNREAVFSYHETEPISEMLPKVVRPLVEKVMSFFGRQQSVVAPLAVREEIFGLIAFSSPDLIEADKPAIMTFANQAAIALEKVRLYEETRELAAFNESVLLSMTEGIALQNTEGIITYTNPSAEIMLGYSPGKLLGSHWKEIVPPDQQSHVMEADIRRSRGESDRYELDLIKKEGQRISVLASGSPLIDENAKSSGSLVVFTEITERIKAEKEIQQHVRRLDALRIIDQAIIGSFDLNISLNIILEQMLVQLEVSAAAVLSYQEDIQVLQFTNGRGFQTAALQYTELRLGEGYAGRVAQQREHVFIPDLNQDQGDIHNAPQFDAENFISYYGVPLMAKGKLVGVLEIFNRSALDPTIEWVNYLQLLAGQVAIAIDNTTLFENMQRANVDLTLAYDATIEGWARALELKDMETVGHSRRVVDLTMNLAREMGIKGENLGHTRRGALLHDIGKMGVPDSILQKPGKLTDEEWEIMRQHPVYARDWLTGIQYLRPALDIPYSHHERWDGTGYPEGLSGEQIPLEARIFTIVDVWDALSSDRPYRKAWPREQILGHIKEESGKHFDPQVVEAFLELLKEWNDKT